MSETSPCPECGKPVGPSGLQGLCPECLIKVGLGSQAPGSRRIDAAPPGGTARVFVAPELKQVAQAFPQLEIVGLLGQGGMGVVYKARQSQLDRLVALKILSLEAGADAAFAERFTREAKTLARLNHPGIVTLYDFGQANGFYYFLMEYVDGVTLRELLNDHKLAPTEALAIVPRICEALQYAHDQGIVHRDIKPENILLDKAGRVKIADFGLAKLLGADPQGLRITRSRDVMGTPNYMAPEQLERPLEVDHRADIYSLGVVFYELLTGELPLGKFPPPSKKVVVDVRLDEVVLRTLEKEPARRYQHAGDVQTDVETIASSFSPSAPAATRTSSASWLRHFIVVGRRGDQAALHWPGILLSTTVALGVMAWLAAAVSWAAEGAVKPAPMLIALCSGLMITGLRLRRARTMPVSQLPSLDALCPPPATPLAPAPSWLTAVRWTARLLGTALLVFYGVFVLAEGLPPLATQPEGVRLNFAALTLMLLGFVLGWKHEGTAALLIASGWTLWHISENRVQWNFFQTPLPIAALYALCWWASSGRKTGRLVTIVGALALCLFLGRLFCPTNVFISGVITDAATGQPVRHAEISLVSSVPRDPAKGPMARSGADGHYRLYVSWFSADRRVTLTAPGHAALEAALGPRRLGEKRLVRDFRLAPSTPPSSSLGPVPPVVVRTLPEAGRADVAPGLTEIQVTFSAPMAAGGWSWCVWDPAHYPESAGETRFLEDQRTCVLPVRLRPGRVYALWVNSDQYKHFRDQNGQAAVPYLLVFETKP
jgi:predicted Ser/Thr protein kinase